MKSFRQSQLFVSDARYQGMHSLPIQMPTLDPGASSARPGRVVSGDLVGWLGRQFGAAFESFARREVRVLWLLSTILVLSVSDLMLTVTHAATLGMAEANPLARAIIATGSTSTLALWKAGSLVPIAVLCLCYRKRAAAELCAWVGVIALSVVAVHWVLYAGHLEIITNGMVAVDHSHDHRWVVLGSAR